MIVSFLDLLTKDLKIKHKSTVKSIGDDAAVLDYKSKKVLVSTRYELNNKYLNQLEENGLVASGKNKDTNLVEVVEVKDHPWFIGVQYHPEYKSTVLSPHPLFVSFVSAAILNKNK